MWEVWLGSGLFKGALNWCSSSTSTMTNALIMIRRKIHIESWMKNRIETLP